MDLKNTKEKYLNKKIQSLNYGEFIVKEVYEVELKIMCKILFIDTGCEKDVHFNSVQTHSVRDDFVINKCSKCDMTEEDTKIYILKDKTSLCQRHYAQMRRYKKILKRTKFDKNEILKNKFYSEMIIYDKNNKEKCRTIIDNEDVDSIVKYKWCLNGTGYVLTSGKDLQGNKKWVRLHRLVMNCPEDMYIDHINRNPLDNRKENLRICNQKENNSNRSMTSKNTSGVIGVWFNKKSNKWEAELSCDYKKKLLSRFENKEDAIKARLEAELKYFGEFAPQIHLFEEYGVDSNE